MLFLNIIFLIFLKICQSDLTILQTTTDYFTSRNAFDDNNNLILKSKIISDSADILLSPEELIKSKGYPYESYEVETADGFILKLHRIPGNVKGADTSKLKAVVYLQHGFLCASTDFLINLANQSLGYILADNGMDVWLGESRGNKYSRKHKIYTPEQSAFWDWSYDEMAKYDLPAFLKFILTKTERPYLYYVGHSQGTMIGFAKFSEDAELASKVKVFFALAPVVYLGNMISPLSSFAPFSTAFAFLTDILGQKEFMPSTPIRNWLATSVCPRDTLIDVCTNLLYLIGGPHTGNFNKSRISVIYGHYPAGSSVENYIHFLQGIQSNKFRHYDYGLMRNLKIYHRLSPPNYIIENVNVPVEIFWGEKDWLTTPKDVKRLIPEIPKLIGNHYYPNSNHWDFVYGTNAAKDYYAHILTRIEQTNTGTNN